MDKFLELAAEAIGPAHDWHPLRPEVRKHYGKGVPNRLRSIWKDGVGGFGGGRLWLVDPQQYEATLEQWLADTPYAEMDRFTVFARTAFGDLFAWGEQHGLLTVSPLFGQLFLQDNRGEVEHRDGDLTIEGFFATMEKAEVDITDEAGRSLFARVARKLGDLTENDVYGVVPAPALGGRILLKNMRKLQIAPYLSILAQVTPREILKDPFG
jgi:hypothetical protein